VSSFFLLTPIVFWAFVAGHWPTFVHMMLIWGVYFLFRARPVLRSSAVVLAAVAVALLAAAPQLAVTMELMQAVTRQKIGLAMAGENSFLPTSAVLAFFPFLQGSRTPNFFPQSWWGSWHLCEMLGYVGLVTLALAGAVIWRGFRRGAFTPLIRAWTWMLIGAGVFMVGYYMPTYWLIHKIPVLGVMRCPARMVLAVDMALATLSAVGVHLLLTGDVAVDDRLRRLRRTLRSAVLYVLPAVMLGWLSVWATIAALGLRFGFDDTFGALQFVGGPRHMFAALGFHVHDGGGWSFTFTPAVWVPLALAAATAAVVMLLLRMTRSSRSTGGTPVLRLSPRRCCSPSCWSICSSSRGLWTCRRRGWSVPIPTTRPRPAGCGNTPPTSTITVSTRSVRFTTTVPTNCCIPKPARCSGLARSETMGRSSRRGTCKCWVSASGAWIATGPITSAAIIC
jgi:hypothetical protein